MRIKAKECKLGYQETSYLDSFFVLNEIYFNGANLFAACHLQIVLSIDIYTAPEFTSFKIYFSDTLCASG